MQKTTKALISTIIILMVGLVIVLVIRFSTAEDAWLCQNGRWVKHGNPSVSTPTTTCGTSVITTSTPTTVDNIEDKTTNVFVSFPNKLLDPNMMDCSKVFATKRTIIKTQAIGRATLEELLKGPTSQEVKAGYFTSIPIGIKIQKLTIENGVAKIDLSKELEYQVGGSCRVGSIIAEITETLKQFPTVQNVIISIDGRTEEILQP